MDPSLRAEDAEAETVEESIDALDDPAVDLHASARAFGAEVAGTAASAPIG